MSNINFQNPLYLLALIPLFALFISLFFLINKNAKKRVRNIVSLVLHLIICTLFVFSGANLRVLNASTKTNVFILADVSYSNEENYNKIDDYIRQIQNQLDLGTKMGVICYGKNYELLTHLGQHFSSIKKNKVDTSATDLEGALLYANSLFPENDIKRLIIISDGSETDNNALNALEELLNNQVYIDAIYLKRPLQKNEIQINQVSYTEHTFLNHSEIAKVSIQASESCNTEATLYVNGEKISQGNLKLSKGINILSFDLNTSEAGIYRYAIVLEAKDHNIKNNMYYFRQEVKENINVLLLASSRQEQAELTKLYGDSANITAYVNTLNIPTRLEELCVYDEIVLSNVNAVKFNHHEEFITNLELFVSYYGKSVLTFGATYSNGYSNEYMKKYNNMLPVQFEASTARCLALVIDTSASMIDQNRLEMAKQGAIACLDLLSTQDYVTVISFAEDTRVVQPLTSAGNRETIIAAIESMRTSYATMMNAGLQRAYAQIKNTNFDNKEIILLSDGMPNEDEGDILRTVQNMAKDNIKTSVINISCLQGDSFMQDIAKIGNGSYYFVRNANNLVNIILSTVAGDIANTEIEGNFAISVRQSNDKVLDHVNTEFPNITGYNYSRIKGSSNTVLTVPYENEDGGIQDLPLFAYWKYGKGKVSSFTSSIGDMWTKEFRDSENGKQFILNVLDNALPTTSNSSSFHIDIQTKGFSTDISVTRGTIFDADVLQVTLTSPSGNEETKYLRLSGENYKGTFYTDEIGEYSIKLVYTSREYNFEEIDYFFYSYSKEYDAFSVTDESLLYNLTKENGTVSTSPTYILNNEERMHRSYTSYALPLLIASLVLFLIDIAIRKLRLSDFKFHKKNKGALS